MENHIYSLVDFINDKRVFTGRHKECVDKYNEIPGEHKFYSISFLGERLDSDGRINLPSIPEIEDKEEEALFRYNNGEQLNVSTFIDDDTIIAGYGGLEYEFEFPLPVYKIKEIYGTTSWKQYLETKQKN